MRLIKIRNPELTLEEFNDLEIPPYAILSHTWQDDEISFSDLPLYSNGASYKAGHAKIVAFCAHAQARGFEYAWIDTCCINKSSTTELSEAINAMYRWYSRAGVCFTYLSDHDLEKDSLQESRWFKRGWTLQELIAPREVEFYDKSWRLFGTKSELKTEISRFTGIAESVLAGASPQFCSIAQRMSWAAGRETTRKEDRAYSLLGLFDVTLPLIYGASDSRNAFILLQEEVIKHSDDQTIFAWDQCFPDTLRGRCGLLADSPDAFAGCSGIIRSPSSSLNTAGYGMTNVGLILDLYTEPYDMRTYIAVLDCTDKENCDSRYGILVEYLQDERQFARVRVRGKTRLMVKDFHPRRRARRICVQQKPGPAVNERYGFWIRSLKFPDCHPEDWLEEVQVFSRAPISQRPSQGCFIEMLPSFTGTVGVVRLPARDRKLRAGDWTDPYQICQVVFGFDDNFKPVISATICDTILQSSAAECEETNYHNHLTTSNRSSSTFGPLLEPILNQNMFKHHYSIDIDEIQENPGFQRILSLGSSTHHVLDLGRYGRVEITIKKEKCLSPIDYVEEATNADFIIWTVEIIELEKLVPPNHEEAVSFGIEKPCVSSWRTYIIWYLNFYPERSVTFIIVAFCVFYAFFVFAVVLS